MLPDGSMQSWSPYGVIDNCVRGGDAASDWIAFLNRDPLARRQWCGAMGYTRLKHLTPRTFIDEVSRGLDAPCGGR